MPFDKLDKKAREAAEKYNTAYNDGAWSKMEALLDKHMPLNADKHEMKRTKFHEKWLFLLLSFMAVSFIILVIKPWKTKPENNALTKNHATIIKQAESNTANKTIAIKPVGNASLNYKSNTDHPSLNKPADKILSSGKPNEKTNQQIYSGNESADKNFVSYKNNTNKNNRDEGSSIPIYDVNTEAAESQNTFLKDGFINQKIENRIFERKNIISNNISAIQSIQKDKSTNARAKNSYSTKRNKFLNSFFVSASIGPDVSAINGNNIGTSEIVYGAGIGYKFGKSWQLRTGFYSTKKVYQAKPSDYSPPSVFWTYYPDLEDIDADCRVNEIPLIINYAFMQNPKQSWFASAGISSWFMKRETYNYLSKTPMGPEYKSYTIYGENKHYFSSLRISAGYERALNKTISLSAEPYLSLPLSGIGYGKVKLKSAGVLFSINAKPFAKK